MTTHTDCRPLLLILDDDPLVGCTMQFIAEDLGLETRFVSTATAFFAELEACRPTHIALDLIMPDMDGMEVIKGLAERGCRARIIITSGVGARVLDAAGRSAAEHGLDFAGVLSKPFAAGDLRELLASAPVAQARATRPEASPQPADPPPLELGAADLRRGLEANELAVVFQPKIACKDARLTGFEALVRWLHPDYGPIPPDRFVPLAEASGLITELTEQVLDRALRWFAPLDRATSGLAEDRYLSLAVNLSAKSFSELSFVDRLAGRCERLQLAPARLILELTETSAMDDPVASLGLITRLRMKGFHLSIDDFGTGFSSMLQLVRLPFSELKVDKSFVMTALQSEESRTVVKSIVHLGRSLGLRTVAEGVETAEVLDFLGEIGCDQAQGYHIARPMTGDTGKRWMRERSATR